MFCFQAVFIVEDEEREKYRKKIRNIWPEGMLITGFDTTYTESPLIVYDGKDYSFEQACVTAEGPVDMREAEQKRIFDYKGVSVGVVSCGEVLNPGFNEIAFKEGVPDLLFGCVHYGKGFRTKVYRQRLKENSIHGWFFSYHTNNLDKSEGYSSFTPPKHINHISEDMIELTYEADITKRHKFRTNKKK